MRKSRAEPRLVRKGFSQSLALICLLVLGGIAIIGPSGILAWSENQRLLDQRQAEVKALSAERAELQNRVRLLDPRHMDSDLAGELLRKDLNVVHPDEKVMLLP
jgi:cell division protein FtsB